MSRSSLLRTSLYFPRRGVDAVEVSSEGERSRDVVVEALVG